MATRNACIDAIMLHARNLIRFLFAVDRQSYSQENFVSGWKPTGDAAERLKDVLPILHQHFAHLSPQRLKPELPRKQFRQYQDRLPYDILEIMSDFVKIARSQESRVAGRLHAVVETARHSSITLDERTPPRLGSRSVRRGKRGMLDGC